MGSSSFRFNDRAVSTRLCSWANGRSAFCALAGILISIAAGSAAAQSPATSDGARQGRAASISSEVYLAPKVKVAETARTERQALTLLAGAPGSTALQMAQDLAVVLGSSESVRVVPVVGREGPQNLLDLLYLPGIDLAITQTDVLAGVSRGELANIKSEQIAYIAKLYNSELHVVAHEGTASLAELAGKKVNFGEQASGSQYTARRVFTALGITVQEVNLSHSDAMAQLERGEIAATVFIGGKPSLLAAAFPTTRKLRLLPVAYPPSLEADYLPARITHANYPELIREGHSIDTIAVGTVLAVFNWPQGDERFERSLLFVENFFARLEALRRPARHVKWREMHVPAPVPGISQFAPARDWIDRERKALAGQGLMGRQRPPSGKQSGGAEQARE